MSEPDRNAISARLWRLPRQLLLALINATAILVIAAAILVLVVMARIDHFAGRVVGTMSEAVLAKVDLPPKEVLANLRNLTEEMRTLTPNARNRRLADLHPGLGIEPMTDGKARGALRCTSYPS